MSMHIVGITVRTETGVRTPQWKKKTFQQEINKSVYKIKNVNDTVEISYNILSIAN